MALMRRRLLCCSWYVNEHKARKIADKLLPSTMSIVTSSNSALAIAAGLICDLLVRHLSLPVMSPFLFAIPCLIISFIIISIYWTENHGDTQTPILQLYSQGVKIILSDSNIMKLGIIQSTIESSMFIFVFVWTPILTSGQSETPLGLIFSIFMISIMLGSFLFKNQITSGSKTAGDIVLRASKLYLCCHIIAGLCADQSGVCPFQRQLCFIAFIILEMCLGMYFPAMATLRSKYVPESHRSTIINLFRIPLNLFTAIILLCIKNGFFDTKFVIFSCTSFLSLCAVLASRSLRSVELKKIE